MQDFVRNNLKQPLFQLLIHCMLLRNTLFTVLLLLLSSLYVNAWHVPVFTSGNILLYIAVLKYISSYTHLCTKKK